MAARLKIAVWHNLPSGGGKRALHAQVRGLVARGHHVESWCPPTADQTYLPLRDLVREHILPLEMPARSGWGRPFRRLLWNRQQVPLRLRAMEAHCRRCADEIARGGFDVLLAAPCTFFRTSPMGRLTPLPSVLYLQEPYRWLFEALPRLPWVALDPPSWRDVFSPRALKARVRDAMTVGAARVQLREEIRNAAGFSALLVNSLFSRESVLRAYGLDSRFCPLGVDVEQFPFSDAPRKAQVISLGLLYYGKGAERSVRAIAQLPADRRPTLLWVGNGADPLYQAEIEALARSLDVKFDFRKSVTDAALIRHLQESMAMIYTPRLEPFGYAPLEANCCGTPVVAIAEGGVRETVHDGVNGFLVPGDDPAALAAALGRLIDSPATARAMGLAGRESVATHWNLAYSIDRLEQDLRAVLASRSPSLP